MICSQVKLTYQGKVLLDFEEEMESAPAIPASGQAQVVDFAGAVLGKVFGRGNERNGVSWSRLKQWTSHAEAQEKAWTSRLGLTLGEAGTLTVEIKDGPTLEIENFVLESAEWEPMVYDGFAVRESYSGQGEELTILP